jgi:hypothetical protein
MEIQHQTQHGMNADSAERFGTVPNHSASFRNLPNDSESFRTIPNPSEAFGTVPNQTEHFRAVRKEAHTVTVRDAARMFEQAGVARTERSIVNWCQPNATGVARLDAYFDPNERRYYITEQSIQNAVAEEKAKAFRNAHDPSEDVRKPNTAGEQTGGGSFGGGGRENNSRAVEEEIRDLQILNKLKDRQIELMTAERKEFIHEMLDGRQRIGQLEERLLQLGAPAETRKLGSENVPNH